MIMDCSICMFRCQDKIRQKFTCNQAGHVSCDTPSPIILCPVYGTLFLHFHHRGAGVVLLARDFDGDAAVLSCHRYIQGIRRLRQLRPLRQGHPYALDAGEEPGLLRHLHCAVLVELRHQLRSAVRDGLRVDGELIPGSHPAYSIPPVPASDGISA